ncbi:Acyl-CoA-binding domain-containing protein 6 [Eumeta japonica]|uniref:Acyl-CoA-binding domain-containing protein 6 n=1 Tax=Eumeta variegata TaxID=151549 RepID=A0A4C1XJS8_EUMVA|nr:Acyl-CoA-binding domain-containing protein 6 [Eumeta japonica]
MAEAISQYPDSDFSEDESSTFDDLFIQASNHIRKITDRLNNNQLLELYGFYKQGTEGQCNTPKPGWLDGRGRKKWDAWHALHDMPKEEAQQKYVTLVRKLDPDFIPIDKVQRSKGETWVTVSSLLRPQEAEIKLEDLSLIDAAREDYGNRVAELLKQEPNLKNSSDANGLTALHWAADRNAVNALRSAIEGGISVAVVDDGGQTALHYAAACGHMAATKILLEAGADPLVKDAEDCTPLDLATDEDVRDLLRSHIS